MARIYFPDELMPEDITLLDSANEGDTIVFSICYGGDLATAIKLADVIRSKRLNTEARYIVASASVLCYCAGNNRYALPDAKFLLHEAVIPYYAETNVNETELRSEADAMRQYNEIIISLISSYTGADRNLIEQLMRANGGEGTWLDINNAIDLNFVTELLNASNEALLIANIIKGGNAMDEAQEKANVQTCEQQTPTQTPVSNEVLEALSKVSTELEALASKLSELERKQVEFGERIEHELKKPTARIGAVDASIVDKKIENKPSGKLTDYYKDKFSKLIS